MKSPLYPSHTEQQAKNDFTLLAPLVRQTEDFQSAETVNKTLGALHNLLAEGRISPRRAAVIACVDSLILRTLPAMAKEDDHTSFIVDIPGPDTPEPARTELDRSEPDRHPHDTNVTPHSTEPALHP